MPRYAIEHNEFAFSRPYKRRRNANGDRLYTVAPCANPDAYSERDGSLPMIRLRGRWLKELGYRIGKRFAVKVEGKRLIVTLEREK